MADQIAPLGVVMEQYVKYVKNVIQIEENLLKLINHKMRKDFLLHL